MCIVVVDDEPDVRELVHVLLEDEGYRVLSFALPTPVTRLRERDEYPNLFLIDIMLPEMSGIELAERLVETGFRETPKIAMSASGDCLAEARRSQLFKATMNKPFEINDLLDCIERLTPI